MKISIYQINMDRDRDRICFMGHNELKMFQGSDEINSNIYDRVFDGKVNCRNLEEVYEMFNLNQPADYTGRSLSVSDVVVVTAESGEQKAYYCDSFGFKEVEFNMEMAKEMQKDTMKVVLLEPGKMAKVVEMGTSLEAMQQAVGGMIEAYYPFAEEVCIVCNEEGKINGLPLNRAIYDENKEMLNIIAGPCFICDCRGEDFASLSKEQLDRYQQEFKYPEQFRVTGKGTTAVPYTPGRESLPYRSATVETDPVLCSAEDDVPEL